MNRREPAGLMKRKVLVQHLTKGSHQVVSIKHPSRLEPHGRPLLVNLVGHLHVYINTYTQHHVTYVGRVTNQLQQDSGNFFLTDQNVIGPFQTHTWNTDLTQRLHDSEPDNKTQALQLTHSAVNTQHQTVIDVFRERTHPFSPAPPATSSLPLRKHQKRRRLEPLNGAERFSIRGID
ncbi:hypothetical protein D3C85_1247270 [compost metagenome]